MAGFPGANGTLPAISVLGKAARPENQGVQDTPALLSDMIDQEENL